MFLYSERDNFIYINYRNSIQVYFIDNFLKDSEKYIIIFLQNIRFLSRMVTSGRWDDASG